MALPLKFARATAASRLIRRIFLFSTLFSPLGYICSRLDASFFRAMARRSEWNSELINSLWSVSKYRMYQNIWHLHRKLIIHHKIMKSVLKIICSICFRLWDVRNVAFWLCVTYYLYRRHSKWLPCVSSRPVDISSRVVSSVNRICRNPCSPLKLSISTIFNRCCSVYKIRYIS